MLGLAPLREAPVGFLRHAGSNGGEASPLSQVDPLLRLRDQPPDAARVRIDGDTQDRAADGEDPRLVRHGIDPRERVAGAVRQPDGPGPERDVGLVAATRTVSRVVGVCAPISSTVPRLGRATTPLGATDQSEVGEVGSVALGDQDVARLHVAVDQTVLVRLLEGVVDLRADSERALEGERGLTVEERSQVFAFHIPHREVELAVRIPAP
jgi:hypothetical protein